MHGWVGDIEQATKENETFRTVLFTGEHSQLTVMCIPRGDSIGLEVHPDHDQFIRVEQGRARAIVGPERGAVDEIHDIEADWAIVVPAGVWHDLVNTGDGDLKVYSVYSPAHHPAGTVHRTKADAEAAEHAAQPV